MIRDIDFFAPYKGQVKEQKNKSIYMYTTVGTLTAVILGSLIYNTYNINLIQNDIDGLKAELESPAIQESIIEAENVNKSLDILGRYNTAITSVTNEISTRKLVSTNLLNNISSTLPSDVSFKNINIAPGSLSISATSKSRTAIAEVQHNLKELIEVGDVYIGSISGEKGEYSFDLKCVLKEGN